jgi:hypothetical protein
MLVVLVVLVVGWWLTAQCNPGLEEVTLIFLESLLSEPWVRENYYVSDYRGDTVVPYGQVLLSRFPIQKYGHYMYLFNINIKMYIYIFNLKYVIDLSKHVATRLIQHQYTPHKRVIVAQLELNKRTVYVPVVHLTSDRQESCSTKRAHQLNVVFDRTCPAIGDDAGTLSLLFPFVLVTHTWLTHFIGLAQIMEWTASCSATSTLATTTTTGPCARTLSTAGPPCDPTSSGTFLLLII